jgi:hypothetical protein
VENFVQMCLAMQSRTMILNKLTICLTSAALCKNIIIKGLHRTAWKRTPCTTNGHVLS